MSTFYKLWASRVNVGSSQSFVGDEGRLFYDEQERILRISDGKTPGGIPLFGGGDGGTIDPSPETGIKELNIQLTGNIFKLIFENQNINKIISVFVYDENGEEVSVLLKKTANALTLKSNINLDNHELIISYI